MNRTLASLIIVWTMLVTVIGTSALYKLDKKVKQLRSYQLDIRNNIYVLYDDDRVVDTLSPKKCELDSVILKDNL